MIYLRGGTIWRAHHRKNIETDILIHMIILHIMINGTLKVTTLMIVNGCLRLYKSTVTARLHFNKHDRILILGNDIYVTMTRFPITCHNGIAHTLKVVSSTVFTPFT